MFWRGGGLPPISETVCMATLKRKVFAYITHAGRLLVFSYMDFPEVGVQVPAGTLEEGEDPESGVLREAWEETGLEDLKLQSFLGESHFPVPEWNQIHHRFFYHLTCASEPPERWRHYESLPSDGSEGPYALDLFWVRLPHEVPLLAPGHDALASALMRSLGIPGS